MNAQERAATAVMEEWLSHPQELGKKPAKLEIAGEFDLHYYIFKFKKSVLGSWKVAVVFFGCNITAIILRITAYPILMRSDCIRTDKFYEKQEPTELCLPDREALVQRLLENKFKPAEDGGYRRKKFSFLKDTINYYVRITEDTSIANALRREVDHCERARIKPNNLCILLLVYMDEVGECERKEIKEFGKRFIIAEMMAVSKLSVTFLAIAVDSRNSMGYFVDIKKRNLSLYSYGCKMVKRLFLSCNISNPF